MLVEGIQAERLHSDHSVGVACCPLTPERLVAYTDGILYGQRIQDGVLDEGDGVGGKVSMQGRVSPIAPSWSRSSLERMRVRTDEHLASLATSQR